MRVDPGEARARPGGAQGRGGAPFCSPCGPAQPGEAARKQPMYRAAEASRRVSKGGSRLLGCVRIASHPEGEFTHARRG